MLKVPTAVVARRAERIVVRAPGYALPPALSADVRQTRERLSSGAAAASETPADAASQTEEPPLLDEDGNPVEFEVPDAGLWDAKVAARRKEKIRDGDAIRARTEYSLTLAVMVVVGLVGYQTMGHPVVAALARIVSSL
jgi:hypothetical protein